MDARNEGQSIAEPRSTAGSGPVTARSAEPRSETAADLPIRDVAIDWEALEDAFENNAPEVHSYLQLATGEVIRVVDGVADPQMHARIASDGGYLRIDPVSSREQYRWMERFIPLVEDLDLRGRLGQAIDGKGAFRRFKDVLMAQAEDRERWFEYRSERLKTFMDAWLVAHAIHAIERANWPSVEAVEIAAPPPASATSAHKRAETLRKHLVEVSEALGPKDLEALAAFAEFLRARRAARHRTSVETSSEPADSERDEDVPASSLRDVNVSANL